MADADDCGTNIVEVGSGPNAVPLEPGCDGGRYFQVSRPAGLRVERQYLHDLIATADSEDPDKTRPETSPPPKETVAQIPGKPFPGSPPSPDKVSQIPGKPFPSKKGYV